MSPREVNEKTREYHRKYQKEKRLSTPEQREKYNAYQRQYKQAQRDAKKRES